MEDSHLETTLLRSCLSHVLDPSPHSSSALTAFLATVSRPDWQCLEEIDVPLKQHSLSVVIDEALHQHLLSTAPSTRARALALSSALPHAGDWLIGIPSATLGLHLQDQKYRCCLRYWLGLPLHSSSYSCPECHNTADPYGDHQVGCGGNGDRITRHNTIRDIVFNAAQSAALAVRQKLASHLSSCRSVGVEFIPL